MDDKNELLNYRYWPKNYKSLLNLLIYESKVLYDTFSSIFDLDSKKIKNIILKDLNLISSICCYADNKLSGPEVFAFSFVKALFLDDKKNIDKCLSIRSTSKTTAKNIIKEIITINKEYLKSGASPNKFGIMELVYQTINYDKAAKALYRFATVIIIADGKVTTKEKITLENLWSKLYKDKYLDITKQYIFIHDGNDVDNDDDNDQGNDSSDKVLEEISQLIGLNEIKTAAVELLNFLKIQKIRKEKGYKITPITLHSVFYGPPGTGKTTVARLIGKIFKATGFLTKGHIVEVDRAGLISGYVGQTSTKVEKVIQKALDGVLFIDEAYTLANEHSSDFGHEAIGIILKRMEDYRDRLVVIAAGYTDEMKMFIDSNPGLKSRFTRHYYFDHYNPDELMSIFEFFSNNAGYNITEKFRELLMRNFIDSYSKKQKDFGNGRYVRNVFEKAIHKQATRIVNQSKLTDNILSTLTEEDLP